jgi:hypothetical protein
MKRRTTCCVWFLCTSITSCGGKADVSGEETSDASVRAEDDDEANGPGANDDDARDDDDTTEADDGDDDTPGPDSPEPDILVDPEPNASVVDGGQGPVVVISFDGGDGGVASCGGDAVRASQKDVNLLLVFDQSGSMLDTNSDGVDRWTLLTEATASTLDSVSDKMSLGLELYPHRMGDPIPSSCAEEGSCCEVPEAGDAIVVPIAPGTEAGPDILDTLSAATPAGGTPTAAALQLALDYFTSGDGKDLSGDRAILLVTDGGPMCNTDLTCQADTCTVNIDGDCPDVVDNCCDASFEASHLCLDEDGPREQIEALYAAGVRTAVMGIPGTSAYADQLDAYARAGGLESSDGDTSYYAITEAGGLEALEAALTAITRQLVQTCVLELDEPPPDPNKVNVRIEGEFVPQQGADGWELDVPDAGPATVTLKGETCERVEADGVESISVLFGCPTIVRAPAAR